MTEFPSGGDSTRVGRAEKRRGKENKRDGGHKVAVHRPREEFPSRGDENSWNSFGELAPPPAHAWRHQSEIDSNIFRWGGGEGGAGTLPEYSASKFIVPRFTLVPFETSKSSEKKIITNVR